jgi:hypothetical protein
MAEYVWVSPWLERGGVPTHGGIVRYQFDLDRMVQVNTSTGYVRRIRAIHIVLGSR